MGRATFTEHEPLRPGEEQWVLRCPHGTTVVDEHAPTQDSAGDALLTAAAEHARWESCGCVMASADDLFEAVTAPRPPGRPLLPAIPPLRPRIVH